MAMLSEELWSYSLRTSKKKMNETILKMRIKTSPRLRLDFNQMTNLMTTSLPRCKVGYWTLSQLSKNNLTVVRSLLKIWVKRSASLAKDQMTHASKYWKDSQWSKLSLVSNLSRRSQETEVRVLQFADGRVKIIWKQNKKFISPRL